MSPYHAIALAARAAIFEDVPDFGCFPAQADGDVLVEAANGIDQESIEIDALLWGITELAIRCTCDKVMIQELTSTSAIRLGGQAKMARQESQRTERYVLRPDDSQRFLN